MPTNESTLPLIIAGPIIRHIAKDTFTLWLVSSEPVQTKIHLFCVPQTSSNIYSPEHHHIPVGVNCFINTLIVTQNDLFNDQSICEYDVELSTINKPSILLSETYSDLLYANQTRFSVKYSESLSQVVHGSCRKAHFEGGDALVQIDNLIANSFLTDEFSEQKNRPDLLLLTGDQVYVDDVAGPMICAINQTVELLGLFSESFEGSTIASSNELSKHKDAYYQRENLLPHTKANEDVSASFFKGKRKPIFTSVNAKNHLIALNEMLALYLLSWSSRLWPLVKLNKHVVDEQYHDIYSKEQVAIEKFAAGLNKVERGLAHIPVYMIFDDHDVSDDWNLTRAWEEDVYGNPFSKRIVGNALVAYLLCQGMGNPKRSWKELLDVLACSFNEQGIQEHNKLIDAVLGHTHWQYRLATSPPIQILDTRTQRWRSESNPNKPSGLMDWEALCDLQQDIIGQPSVIMVSPAPVYGVKFIETIQRLFTLFGGALMVDAENWMAHRGTANVMLNIFRHIKTPPHFIILSGDVHYSFVYDVTLRFKRNSPKITQFTCSGIHNQFPDRLLRWFERLNHWLYGHRSPLNFLTKRRNMSIKERENDYNLLDIVNATSLGLLELDEQGHESACKLILANGDVVTFSK